MLVTGLKTQEAYDGKCNNRLKKPDTKGSELVPELKVVTDNVFEKSKASALTSEAFAGFIEKNDIEEFYITGADATGCQVNKLQSGKGRIQSARDI